LANRIQVWSCGGGTQSSAIAALVVQGKLPKPDLSLMVDTERENSDTFPYFESHSRPALAAVGVEVHVIKKSDFATCDLRSTNDKYILMPGFTNQSGKVGRLPQYCTGEWKREVANRWLRKVQKVKECDLWLGFSVDEAKRIKADRVKWRRSRYPLIELGLNRIDCVGAVVAMGWPKPPRSSCWMCPNKSNREWTEMQVHRPQDFTAACDLEDECRARDHNFYLHQSCVPLREIDFREMDSVGVGNECQSGWCFN
jgi:hypothetical protein